MKLTNTILLCVLLVTSTCDMGVRTTMARERMHKQWGSGGRKKEPDAQRRSKKAAYDAEYYEENKEEADNGIEVDTSPEADALREVYKMDFKRIYDDFIASNVKNRKTKQMEKQSLGVFHDFFLDFLLLDLDDVKTYSRLNQYLPERDEHGEFPERWLYFRTLESDPEIQDGPTGPVSDRFYDTFWQGITIRVCGDARTKCALTPRGHLKSTVGGVTNTLGRMLRDPAERHTIRCGRTDLAKQFLEGVKRPFQTNDDFRRLFGALIPANRKAAWNTERIQLQVPQDQRRGFDPTLQTAGEGTDLTGTHYDNGGLDDIVNEKNSKTPMMLEKVCETVSATHAQRDPGSNLNDLGTRWDDNDGHGAFVGKPGRTSYSGSLAEDSCFFVATVLDGDTSVAVAPLKNGLLLTQLGYGKPIWPEGFGLRTIQAKRRGMVEDRLWFGQMFNQFIGTSNRIFNRAWIKEWPEEYERLSPVALAQKLRLNITIGFDTASGKEIQTKRLDPTAGLVLGQTPDKKQSYILDGFREMLPAEQIPLGIVDLARKWHAVTQGYVDERGNRKPGLFRVGVEKTVYTSFLHMALQTEQKKQGVASIFAIEPLDHKNAQKADRIRILATPYCNGEYLWPKSLVVVPVRLTKDQTKRGVIAREPYDLRLDLESEFVGYHPTATADGLLDSHVYASQLALPSEWKAEPEKHEELRQRGDYSRGGVEEEGNPMMAGYNPDNMEAIY